MPGGKTARFADVVATGGAPEPHVLWGPAAQDAEFQRALKAHRVMTVHQNNVGAKKDYGFVGYHEEPHAEYLVFPRSVRTFEGRRIVGINYDLLAPEARPAKGRPRAAEPKEERPRRPHEPREENAAAVWRAATEVRPEPVPISEPPSVAAPQVSERKRSEGKAPSGRAAPGARWVREVEKAMKELKAGKTVAAYERLQALVAEARGKAGASV